MAIDARTGLMIAGGLTGGYLSDVTENPLTGLLTAGVGIGMGAFMNLPKQAYRANSEVNVGPSINMDYIKEQQLKVDSIISDSFTTRFESFSKRTSTSLEERLEALRGRFNISATVVPPHVIKKQIEALTKAEDAYKSKIRKTEESFDKRIADRYQFNVDLLDLKKERLLNNENSQITKYYNRMVQREEQSISRYLETPQGKTEFDAYKAWVTNKVKNIPHMRSRDPYELYNHYYKEYVSEGKGTRFRAIQKRQEYYSKRLQNDRRDLFNPWFRDYKEGNKDAIQEFEHRSWNLFETFKEDLTEQKKAKLEILEKDHLEKIKNMQSRFDEPYKTYAQKRANRLDKLNNAEQRVTTRFNREQNIYNSLREILRSDGINVGENREEILETIKGIKKESTLRSIETVLSGNTVNILKPSQINVNKWQNNLKEATSIPTITHWLKTVLGNSDEDAAEKAALIFNRSENGRVTLKDGAASFIDKVSSKRVTVPLTSYNKDGIRFHNMGEGNYSLVNQYNPYGAAFVDGLDVNIDGTMRKVEAKDMLRGYDPETLLKYVPENESLDSTLSKIESLFHYNSQEAGKRSSDLSSPMFKNNQGVVDLNTVLRYNQYGEIDEDNPLRKLKMSATKNMASERQRLFNKLASELDHGTSSHLFDGLSLGDLTSINTKGFDSWGIFAPNERGETSVGNRGTNIINPTDNTRRLEGMLGNDTFNKQFSSSQVLDRIDVRNSSLFNSIASSLFGNDVVLGDGAGFFNLGDSDSLRISDRSTIKIPLAQNIAIADEDLLLGLTSEEGLTEYLKNNPIKINNETLAYNTDGSPISLNRAYSEGTIIDGFVTHKDIRLVTESIFDPTDERNIKFFSTGTKSLNTGVSENVFNSLSEIALALNDDKIKMVGNNIEYNGTIYKTQNEFKAAISRSIKEKKTKGTFRPATLISRAEDTGADKVYKMITEGAKGNTVYDKLMAMGGNNTQISAMTAALFTEQKSSLDLKTSLGILVDKQNDAAFRQDFLYHFSSTNFRQAQDKDSFLQRAYNIVAKTSLVQDYLGGSSLTVGSFNKGSSIVGVNKQAKMSWAAITNLKTSGLTNEDLQMFGMKDEGSLYELRSISEERRLSTNSINNQINGKENKLLSVLSNSILPENRTDILSNLLGIDSSELEKNHYLTYNLTYQEGQIKSLNFSRLSTNRSGLYEESDIKLLKQLEKQKLDLLISDLAYKESTTKEERIEARKTLDKKLKEYDTFSRKMLSGDNNLLKEGLSLYSKESSIMQVKYIGGNSDDFYQKLLKKGRGVHSWFISEEEALSKAKQLGVTLEWNTASVEGVDLPSNIKQPGYYNNKKEFIPLASLITREPAQGPLSTDLITFMVDTTIGKGNKGNIFIPLSDMIYYNGMFGDGDQDTVQTLLGKFQEKSQYDSLERKRRPVREYFYEMDDVIKAMKVKGGKTQTKTLADFATEEEYAKYRATGGLKGRNRKTLAAPATGLAVSFGKALELEFGAGNSKEITQSRIMVHQLVENLLKSAHLDTEAFQLVTEQDVERLQRYRSGFLGKKGYEGITKKQYEAELRSTLPSFLGFNSIKQDTIEGKNTYKKAYAIMENIITAELNNAVKVGETPFSPLDLNERRFSQNSMDFINSLNSIIKEQGITDIDYEDGIKHLRKSSGQVALSSMEYLTDLVKNNKGVIAGGVGAMVGIAMLGREQPSFSDSRSQARQYSANMLRSAGTYDEPSQNNTPTVMGQETNSNKAGYILPKAFAAKGMRIGSSMINDSNSLYEEYNSLLDTSAVQDNVYNMTSALFGDGLRSARLQTN